MGVTLPVQRTELLAHNTQETWFAVMMQPVKLHMDRTLPVQNAALLAPNTQKTKYAVMMHPIQAACGYKATCTECCAVDQQWVAQWKSWRCPGRCWLSAWLHTVHQCPQASSCIQGHNICSTNHTGKLQIPARAAVEKEDLPCKYLAHREPKTVYIIT